MKNYRYYRPFQVLSLVILCTVMAAPIMLRDRHMDTPHEAPAPDATGSHPKADEALSMLVFSKTAGFRHASIKDGVRALSMMAEEHGYHMHHTEDAAEFTDDSLAKYHVVIFLCTSGNILEEEQQKAFERYIQTGGSFVGIHSASDTEYGWAWYGKLVGAYFAGHPKMQVADIIIEEPDHVCMHGIPNPWSWRGEWYNFKDVQPGLTILARVDESTYEGGTMGGDHPVIWCHEYDGGRSFYTAIGHAPEAYYDPTFVRHLHSGILWVTDK